MEAFLALLALVPALALQAALALEPALDLGAALSMEAALAWAACRCSSNSPRTFCSSASALCEVPPAKVAVTPTLALAAAALNGARK